MLFTLGTNQPTDDIVSEAAVKAAINYVQVVCQQAGTLLVEAVLKRRFNDLKAVCML